ncbi:hypothetical protein ACQ859_10440 [Roseateles chitinivorans]|uniref:hypothetical protein n=1 Tax=Roseateles chitinivorans TaxID=2917965 RepID=UPI003D675F91
MLPSLSAPRSSKAWIATAAPAPGKSRSHAKPPAGTGNIPLVDSIVRARKALAGSISRARLVARLDRGDAVYIASSPQGGPVGALEDLPTAPMEYPCDGVPEPVRPVRAHSGTGAAAPPASPLAAQRKKDLLWGSGQPEGHTLSTALRKLIWACGQPLDLRSLWTRFLRRNGADPILELNRSLMPLIIKMREDFRTAHDLRRDSADERDFVRQTLEAYLRLCLAQSPADELKRLRSQLKSVRGPWVQAQSRLHRGLVDAARQADGAGRDGEIVMYRQLQRRAALDALTQAFKLALHET